MDKVPQTYTIEKEISSMVKLHASPIIEKHHITKEANESNSTLNDSSEAEGEIAHDSDTSGIYFANVKPPLTLSGNESDESIKFDEELFEDETAIRSPYYLRSSRSRSSSPVASSSTEDDMQDYPEMSIKAKRLRRQTIIPSEAELMLPKVNKDKDRVKCKQIMYDLCMLPTLYETEEETNNENHETNRFCSVENNLNSEKSEGNSNEKIETEMKRGNNDPYVININVHLPKEFGEKDIPLSVNIINNSSPRASLKEPYRERVNASFDPSNTTTESNTSSFSPRESLNEPYHERINASFDPNNTTIESNTSSVSYNERANLLLSEEIIEDIKEKEIDDLISKDKHKPNETVKNDLDETNKPSNSKIQDVINGSFNNSVPVDEQLIKGTNDGSNSERPSHSVSKKEQILTEKHTKTQIAKKGSKAQKRSELATTKPKQRKAKAGKGKTKNEQKPSTVKPEKKQVICKRRNKSNEILNPIGTMMKREEKDKRERNTYKNTKKLQHHNRKISTKHCHCPCLSSSDSSDSSCTGCSECGCDFSSTSSSFESFCSCESCSSSYSSSSSD